MFAPKVSTPRTKADEGSTGKTPPRRAPFPARPSSGGLADRAFADIPLFSPARTGAELPVADGIGLAGAEPTRQDPAASSAAAPPSPATDAAAPGASVTFGIVDSPFTPLGMAPRIPPRIGQGIEVAISGPDSVEVSVQGSSEANGMATVNGEPTASLDASGQITLVGTGQTAPGSAGNLRLVATIGETIVGMGNSFTICAIPRTVTISQGGLIKGRFRGVIAITDNDSDSGPIEDLDKVMMEEQVEWVNGEGCFEGVTQGDTSGPEPADVSPHGPDGHGYEAEKIDGKGSIDARQYFIFHDLRSGTVGALVTNSGFNIRRKVVDKDPETGKEGLWITTTKAGMAIASSGANPGRGYVTSGSQRV